MSIARILEKVGAVDRIPPPERKRFEAEWLEWRIWCEDEEDYLSQQNGAMGVVVKKSNHYPIARYRVSLGTWRDGKLWFGAVNVDTRIVDGNVKFSSQLEMAASLLIAAHAAISEDVEAQKIANARTLNRIGKRETDKEYGPGGALFGQTPGVAITTRRTGKTQRDRERRAGKRPAVGVTK